VLDLRGVQRPMLSLGLLRVDRLSPSVW